MVSFDIGEMELVITPRAPRLVLDTNVVLDCLVFGDPATQALWRAIESKCVDLLAHALTLEELRRVLAYPQCRLCEDAQRDIHDRYAALARLVDMPPGFSRGRLLLPPQFPRCRDADDELFLALAYHTQAGALVSKDRDLLNMRKKAKKFGITILSLAEIVNLIAA